MRAFACARCGHLVGIDDTTCAECGSPVGFDPGSGGVLTFTERQEALLAVGASPGRRFRRCANQALAACNWVVSTEAVGDGRCLSCRLTRTRPADDDETALAAFPLAEAAKRRLVFQLLDLGLPIEPYADVDHDGNGNGAGVAVDGLAFDLLSSRDGPVTIGHADGVITVDLAEVDSVHREQVRLQLGEPYRTLLGHFRHEIAHYYWGPLVVDRDLSDLFRVVFGDERADYTAAIQRHYVEGPPAGWQDLHVSAYAAMHPWEDWAETFAHYLHLRDTLQTAGAFGLQLHGPDGNDDPSLTFTPGDTVDDDPILALVDDWLALTTALNELNRSMGKDDLYPFTLAHAVVAKLGFVHGQIIRT